MIERGEAIEQLKDLYERKGKITNKAVTEDDKCFSNNILRKLIGSKREQEDVIGVPLTDRKVYDEKVLIDCLYEMKDKFGYVNEKLIWSESNDYPTGEYYKRVFDSIDNAFDQAGIEPDDQEKVDRKSCEEQLKRCYEKHGTITTELIDFETEPHTYTFINKHFGGMAEMEDFVEVPLEERNTYNEESLLKVLKEVEEKEGCVKRTFFEQKDNDYPYPSKFKRVFGSFWNACEQANVETYNYYNQCINCGSYHRSLSSHWSNGCEEPEIPEVWKQRFKGILMGDGWVSDNGQNNGKYRFQLSLINKSFIEWLVDELPHLTTKVYLGKSAEDSYQGAIKPNSIQMQRQTLPKRENYHNMWKTQTYSHSWFSNLRDWYSSGEKLYPNDLEMTPEILRFWYYTDGGLRWPTTAKTHGHDMSPNVFIACVNENGRQDFILSLFDDTPLDPQWDSTGRVIKFTVEDTNKFFDYIDCHNFEPFQYKHELEDVNKYTEEKEKMYEYGEVIDE